MLFLFYMHSQISNIEKDHPKNMKIKNAKNTEVLRVGKFNSPQVYFQLGNKNR